VSIRDEEKKDGEEANDRHLPLPKERRRTLSLQAVVGIVLERRLT